MSKNWKYGDVVMEVQIIQEHGLVAEHNQRNPDEAVALGDLVLSVNRVHGNWDEMISQLAKSTKTSPKGMHRDANCIVHQYKQVVRPNANFTAIE